LLQRTILRYDINNPASAHQRRFAPFGRFLIRRNLMLHFSESFAKSGKHAFQSQLAMLAKISAKAFENTQKIIALNISTTKTMFGDNKDITEHWIHSKHPLAFWVQETHEAQPGIHHLFSYERELAHILSSTQAELMTFGFSEVVELQNEFADFTSHLQEATKAKQDVVKQAAHAYTAEIKSLYPQPKAESKAARDKPAKAAKASADADKPAAKAKAAAAAVIKQASKPLAKAKPEAKAEAKLEVKAKPVAKTQPTPVAKAVVEAKPPVAKAVVEAKPVAAKAQVETRPEVHSAERPPMPRPGSDAAIIQHANESAASAVKAHPHQE
jgi:hypothetical protein